MYHYVFTRRVFNVTWTIEVTPDRITFDRGMEPTWMANLHDYGNRPVFVHEGVGSSYHVSQDRVKQLRTALLMLWGLERTFGPFAGTRHYPMQRERGLKPIRDRAIKKRLDA